MIAIAKSNTFRDYLRILFRHKAVIITTFITIMAATVVGVYLKTPYYEAETTMLVTASKKVKSPFYREMRAYPNEVVKTQTRLILSNPVIERTVRVLGLDKRPVDYEDQFSSGLKSLFMAPKYKNLKSEIEAMTPEEKETFLFRRAVKNLKGSIDTEMFLQTELFTISVKDFDPEEAAKIANAVSRAYVIFDLELQLAEFQVRFGEKHSSSVQLRDYISLMKARLSGELFPHEIDTIGPGSVKIIEQAVKPSRPSTINKAVVFSLAFVLSGTLGIILAFGFDRMGQTFRTPNDVERLLDVPFLGSIPKRKPDETLLLGNSNPESARHFRSFHAVDHAPGKKAIDKPLIGDANPVPAKHFESFQMMDTAPKRKSNAKPLVGDTNPVAARHFQSFQNLSGQIDLLIKDKNLQSILVVDAEGSMETAAVIANLGIYLSRNAGHKVLIIDADLRSQWSPSISGIFNISNKPGLTHVLEGRISFDDAVRHMGHNLHVLPSNKTTFNPLTLVGSSMMADLIRRAGKEYDLIFISCADLRRFTDAVLLSSIADGTVLVINENKVKRQVVMNALVPLEKKKINLLGVVLNNRTFEIPEVIYNLT